MPTYAHAPVSPCISVISLSHRALTRSPAHTYTQQRACPPAHLRAILHPRAYTHFCAHTYHSRSRIILPMGGLYSSETHTHTHTHRCAALYCFQSILTRNVDAQTAITQTLLPTDSSMAGVCVCACVRRILTHLSMRFIWRTWLGSVTPVLVKCLHI